MKYYDQFCRMLCKVLLAVCCILAVVMLCCSALQVFSRYVLGHSFTWTEETARYCFIWMDMLGTAVLVYKGGHSVVDLFSHKLKGVVKIIYRTIIELAIFYVGVILARYGAALSNTTMRQTSSSLKLPMGIVYGVIPFCGVLICIFACDLLLQEWVQWKQECKGGNE